MEISRTDSSYRGAPNLARLVSVSVRAFHGLTSDSARRRLCETMDTNRDIWDMRPATERQHYVPQYYLRAWSDDEKHIWRKKRMGNPERGTIKHTAYFDKGYSLPDLSIAELRELDVASKHLCSDATRRQMYFSGCLYTMLIRKINESIPDAQECCSYAVSQGLLNANAIVNLLNRLSLKVPPRMLPTGYLFEETKLGVEGLERLMSIVENDAKPAIKGLREIGIGALVAPLDSALAIYLGKQYFRTKKHFRSPDERSADDRIGFYLHALEADRMCAWFCDHAPATYSALINKTGKPFITSDHPVMNMNTDSSYWDLYFPVSPTYAIMFLIKGRFESTYQEFNDLGTEQVRSLNQMLADDADGEIYGVSEESINSVIFNN